MSRRTWANWLHALLVGAMAVGFGAAAFLLGSVAVQQPLLPWWSRGLIGVIALGALLTCRLALQAVREVWGRRASKPPDVPLETSGNSCGDTHRHKTPS